ncbi:MAG: hypothetical protein MAG453_00774 [Calditrichaeota bacterium]|nr:hypothetical protein [Calditrichota bacterium]
MRECGRGMGDWQRQLCHPDRAAAYICGSGADCVILNKRGVCVRRAHGVILNKRGVCVPRAVKDLEIVR